MPRFNARKLYIVKMLHTSAGSEEPVSAKNIAEFLNEQGYTCDEETVLRDAEQLQRSAVPIRNGDDDSSSFYMGK